MTYILLYLTLFGISLLVPGLNRDRNQWLGFRFFAAVYIVPVYLFLGNVIFGVPLSVLAWVLATIGVAALIYGSFKFRQEIKSHVVQLLHPIFVLPLMLAVVAVFHGGIDYLPFPGDEVASWLKYARQIYVVDSFWTEQLDYHLGGYTNGWPLYVAFANVFFGEFSDAHASIVPFLMHVGLLGFVFDAARFFLKRSGNSSTVLFSLLPWLLVLLLLSLEASWVLFPTFQVVDQPLLYAFFGVFLIGLLGQFEDVELDRAAISIGVLFAAGYLIKIAMLAAGPTLGIFWMSFIWRRYKASDTDSFIRFAVSRKEALTGIKLAAIVLAPLGLISAGWSLNRFGAHCFSSPLAFFSDSHSLTSDLSMAVAGVIGEAMAAYLLSFKFSLTLVSIVVVLLCLKWPKIRWFVLGILVFLIFYVAILHSAYTLCFPPFGEQGLQSFQRYYRPNIRLLHFFAPIIGFYVVTDVVRKYSAIGQKLSAKPALYLGAFLIILAAGNQVISLAESLKDTSTRGAQSGYIKNAIVTIKQDAAELANILKKRNLQEPQISLIAQSGYNVETELAQYFGIKNKPAIEPFRYRIKPPYSWAPTKLNSFTRETSEMALRAWWQKFPVIWPVRTDDWTRSVLATLVTNTACAQTPEAYFLLNRGDGSFECVAKKQTSNIPLN